LVEVPNPKVVLAASFAWNDLGEVELVPVMETKEVLEFIEKSAQPNLWKLTRPKISCEAMPL
jgi:hypothetical protein